MGIEHVPFSAMPRDRSVIEREGFTATITPSSTGP